MAALDIRFRINFQLTSPTIDLKWTDVTNYTASGLVTSNMRIILWIVDGAGTTIHKNGGYDSGDFSSPDIDRSDKAYLDGIALATDANGNAVSGQYTFYCKIKSITSSLIYSANKSFTFSYTAPTVDISQSYSLRTSELTSTDSTTYTVGGITPSITRAHTVTKPTGSGADDPPSSNLVERVIGGGSTPATRLWTGIWVSAISSVISYDMETWGGSTWIVIGDSISDSKSITVTNVDDIHAMLTSLIAFFNRYDEAISSDRVEAQRLESLCDQIHNNWMLYEDAVRNGGDYAQYSSVIAGILNDEGFETDNGSSTTTEIVPYGEGTGTSTGNVITFVATEPSGGNSGDVAIGAVGSLIEWNVYQNVGGTWNYIGNINANNAPLLHSDVTDSPSHVIDTEEDLKTYNMSASTLDSDYDYIDINALFLVNSATVIDMELKLHFGSKEIANYHMTSSVNGYYKLSAKVYRTSVSTQTYESFCEIYGTPNNKINLSFNTAAIALGSIVEIKASSNKDVVGVSGDIICKYLRVQKIS